MPRTLLPIDEILAQLEATPGQIRDSIERLVTSELSNRPDADEWSIAEILAHLRACADMWGERRILAMIARDHPTIRAMNPRTWLASTDYLSLDVRHSLQAFAVQRQTLLEALNALPPDEWLRTATITGAGKPFAISIHNEADAIARHERLHVKQIRRQATD